MTTLLKPSVAYARVGISRVTAWKLEKEGQFPRAVKITEGRKGYVDSEIEDYITAKIAARDAEVIANG